MYDKYIERTCVHPVTGENLPGKLNRTRLSRTVKCGRDSLHKTGWTWDHVKGTIVSDGHEERDCESIIKDIMRRGA